MLNTNLVQLLSFGALLLGLARSDSLTDIDHVVLFMQEIRAFDHYFGTMAGVRGFNDANLRVNYNNQSVWEQRMISAPPMHPWYVNYLGADWPDATQCMGGGSNGWYANHAALHWGDNDMWAIKNTEYSLAFFKRDDIPVQFSLAEYWLVADMYQESVIGPTNPNRVFWASGSINVPGGNMSPNLGGNPYMSNNESPGCDWANINCYPLKWQTAADTWVDSGVDWMVFQDGNTGSLNFDDNPLAWFEQFQNGTVGDTRHDHGMIGQTLETFYARAANGTLPEVSYIIAQTQLSEHADTTPRHGGWLQNKVVDAVMNSPKYNKTALIVSYDESGGWFDHVTPYASPNGTAGEWWYDTEADMGYTFTGPGIRVPFYIISPWTRNGGVYVEHADHTSQIQFIEKWQQAKGRNVTNDSIVPWRRNHMTDLLSAFDFNNPDYSIPTLVQPPYGDPEKDANGVYTGAPWCVATYGEAHQPPVPHQGDAGYIANMSSVVEHGFKPVRGELTEGRYLVFEMSGRALAADQSTATTSLAKTGHETVSQRWVANAVAIGGNEFTLSASSSKLYICANLDMCATKAQAIVFETSFSAGNGYNFKVKGGTTALATSSSGELTLTDGSNAYWKAYSVSY